MSYIPLASNTTQQPYLFYWISSSMLEGFLMSMWVAGGPVLTMNPTGHLYSRKSIMLFWFFTFILLSLATSIRIYIEHRMTILSEISSFGLWRKLTPPEALLLEQTILTENLRGGTSSSSSSAQAHVATSSASSSAAGANQSRNYTALSSSTTSTATTAAAATSTAAVASSTNTKNAKEVIVAANVYLYRESEAYTYFLNEVVAVPLPAAAGSVSSAVASVNQQQQHSLYHEPGHFAYFQLLSTAAVPNKAPHDNASSVNGALLHWLASSEGYSSLIDSPLLHIIIIILVRIPKYVFSYLLQLLILTNSLTTDCAGRDGLLAVGHRALLREGRCFKHMPLFIHSYIHVYLCLLYC